MEELEQIFINYSNKKSFETAVQLLELCEYTYEDAQAVYNKHSVDWLYAQALNLLLIKENGYRLDYLRDIYGMKKKVFSRIMEHGENIVHRKNRLIPYPPEPMPLHSLLKQYINYEGSTTIDFNNISKQLTGLGKIGFVVLRNIVPHKSQYFMDQLVNKDINNYRGLTIELMNKLTTISYNATNNKPDIGVAVYGAKYGDPHAKFYILETTDGETYTFLTLPSHKLIYVDGSYLALNWSTAINEYMYVAGEIITSYIKPTELPENIHNNKYNINFHDMTSHITEKLFEKYDREAFFNYENIVNYILELLTDYVAIHISTLYKTEIYSVFICEKTKLKRALLYEVKELSSVIDKKTDIEFNIGIHNTLLKTFSSSAIFNLLYFKEKHLV